MFCRFKFLRVTNKSLKYVSLLSLNSHVFTQPYSTLDEKVSDGYSLSVDNVHELMMLSKDRMILSTDRKIELPGHQLQPIHFGWRRISHLLFRIWPFKLQKSHLVGFCIGNGYSSECIFLYSCFCVS
jgi:hypothetical protein